MEGGAGVAAGVLGIVGFSITTTKDVYQAIAGIRNAPDTVRRAARSLDVVTQILKQLNKHSHLTQQDSDLMQVIQEYRDVIVEFRKKVKPVEASPKNSKAQRLWQQVKTHLREAEFNVLQSIIQGQMTRLSLYLNILASRPRDANTESIDKLRKILEIQDTHNQALARIADQATLQSSSLTAFMAEADDSHIRVKDIQTVQAATQHGLDTLLQKFEQSSQTMSQNQQNQVMRRLDTVMQMIESLELKGGAKTGRIEKAISDEIETSYFDVSTDTKIHTAVTKLYSYVEAVEDNLYNEEAESLLTALDEIIQFLVDHSTDIQSTSIVMSNSDQQALPGIRKKLTSSDRVVISGREPKRTKRLTKIYERKNVTMLYPTPWGTLQLTMQKGSLSTSPSNDQEVEQQSKALHVIRGTIQLPLTDTRKANISVSFIDEIYRSHSMRLGPTIIVSPILANNAEVFSVISEGNLNAFRRLIAEGAAVLSARDQDGRCLLNHTIDASSPEICRFLIDNGAEVNFIEPSRNKEVVDYRGLASSLSMTSIHYAEADQEKPPRSLLCRRLLLEAGADPSLFPSSGSALELELTQGSPETLQLLLSLGGQFINMNQTILETGSIFGWPLGWHLNVSYSWNAATIEVPLKHGSRVDRLDELGGSCLILALRGSQNVDANGLHDVLCLLINAGADVYGDKSKRSTPSHTACDKEKVYYLSSHPAGIRNHEMQLRDIWKSALTSCKRLADEVIITSVGEKIANRGWTNPEVPRWRADWKAKWAPLINDIAEDNSKW